MLRPHLVKLSTSPNEREEKRRYTFLAGKRREEWTGRAGDGRGKKKKKKDSEAHF